MTKLAILFLFAVPFVLSDVIGRVSPSTPVNVPVPVAVPAVATPAEMRYEIEGVDTESTDKLNEKLKEVKDPEERQKTIDEWIKDLPEEQQTIANKFFENLHENGAAPIPPITTVTITP